MKDFRRLELKEKNLRKEQKVSEVVSIEEFVKNPSNYVINAKPGKFQLVLVDYEKKDQEENEKEKGQKGAQAARRPVGKKEEKGAAREPE